MGSTYAASFLTSHEWAGDMEASISPWLDKGFYKELNIPPPNNTDEVELLLHGLVDRDYLLSAELIKQMKKKVPEDRGSNELINQVVYGTCALLIKAYNLSYEALSIAKGIRKDIPPPLLKLWASAQKMRSFFDLGDLKSTVESTSTGKTNKSLLTRVHSNSSPDAITAASETIMRRISYLYDCNFSDKVEQVLDAKKNWKLLAKITKENAAASKSAEAKFASTVQIAESTHKLKTMMAFRRRLAADRPNFISLSEQILKFLQSDILIQDIATIREIRLNRLRVRSEGIDLFASMMDTDLSPRSSVILYASFSMSMQQLELQGESTPKRHYSHGLKGCDNTSMSKFIQKFGSMYKMSIDWLCRSYDRMIDKSLSPEERRHWRSATITTLHAIAYDFEICDHALIQMSNFIPIFSKLLCSTDSDVSVLSWSILEIVLPRSLVNSFRPFILYLIHP